MEGMRFQTQSDPPNDDCCDSDGAASLRGMARLSGILRSSVTLFTPWFLAPKKVLPSPSSTVIRREESAIGIQSTVPACAVEQETTFTPREAPAAAIWKTGIFDPGLLQKRPKLEQDRAVVSRRRDR